MKNNVLGIEIVQLAKYLPFKHEDLNSVTRTHA